MWVSDRATGQVSSGRLEVTIGPWVWFAKAPDALQQLARSQTTTCSCAVNHASWYTQNLHMAGNVPSSLFSAQLPHQQCTAPGANSASSCHASIKSPKIKSSSAVEWSGLFSLDAGTYDWTFYAFKNRTIWEFPDAAMDVVIVPTTGTGLAGLEAAESQGDTAMTASQNSNPSPSIIAPGMSVNIKSAALATFRISLPAPVQGSGINVTFRLTVQAKGSYAFFTQHRPSEFLAEQLACATCSTGSKYAFWKVAKTYGVKPNSQLAQSILSEPISTAPGLCPSLVSSSQSSRILGMSILLWFGLHACVLAVR